MLGLQERNERRAPHMNDREVVKMECQDGRKLRARCRCGFEFVLAAVFRLPPARGEPTFFCMKQWAVSFDIVCLQ